MRKTMMERYGVEEIFSKPEVKEKSHRKRKNINTNKRINKTINNSTNKKLNNTTKNLHSLHCSFKQKSTREKANKTKLQKYRKETYNNSDKAKITVAKHIEEFENAHNCTQLKKIYEKYGQGWKALQLPIIEKHRGAHFISNEYLPLIEEYASVNHNYRSEKEIKLFNSVNNAYKGLVQHNVRNIIPHLELDIYILDLKLAIEFNGLKWHSIENGMDKDYHLNKSLECRKLGIRLIHIYEFENFNNQLDLLNQFLLGQDNYSKNDFNKNNLIENIPKSEIIYQSKYYTVYGAGKLK